MELGCRGHSIVWENTVVSRYTIDGIGHPVELGLATLLVASDFMRCRKAEYFYTPGRCHE